MRSETAGKPLSSKPRSAVGLRPWGSGRGPQPEERACRERRQGGAGRGCGVVGSDGAGRQQGALCRLRGLGVQPASRPQSWGFSSLGELLNPRQG